jgi:hypothetical protein
LRPKYSLDRPWWEWYYYKQLGRWWGFGIRTTEWHWYDSTFRFNGGGWLGSAAPYVDYQVGCIYVRRYLKRLKVR